MKKIINKTNKHILKTYNRLPLAFKSGKNAVLQGEDGKNYIDFLSGLGVNNLGHGHPVVTKAIKEASGKILHLSNLFHIESQADLAKLIQKSSFKGQSFFCNSGAEANEAAYKFALRYGQSVDKKKVNVLSASNSFHGRTISALNLTGQTVYKENFKPHLPNVKHFKFNDLSDFKKNINAQTCAVFLEVVQGEGGVYPTDKAFLKQVKSLCKKHKALLIFDEVQTGVMRTGKMWAFKHYGLEPDAFTSAKALAGGLPIGALTVKKNIATFFQPGDHASTFGGNPFVTSVGVKVMEYMLSPAFKKVYKNTEKAIYKRVDALVKNRDITVRKLGLMIGLQLKSEKATAIAADCLKEGLILNGMKGSILRLLPPLVSEKKTIDKAFNTLEKVLEKHGI